MKRAFAFILCAMAVSANVATGASVEEMFFKTGYEAYVKKDYDTALSNFRLAADMGVPEAQYNLALMYANGLGVPQNIAEASKWLHSSAEKGVPGAQFNLGVMYSEGQGVAKNYEEAIKWYRKAADQGFPEAQYNLGVMYDNGVGRLQSREEAVKWYRKSAEQGYAKAQHALGVSYVRGEGVVKDSILADMWLILATINLPQEEAKAANELRIALEHEMTGDQITSAKRLASKWKPNQKSILSSVGYYTSKTIYYTGYAIVYTVVIVATAAFAITLAAAGAHGGGGTSTQAADNSAYESMMTNQSQVQTQQQLQQIQWNQQRAWQSQQQQNLLH